MEPIKKSDLINIIQELQTFSQPKLEYEQYITDAISTADLLFYITFEKQDLIGNLVVDLGCGTGNLSIAAALLGAGHVVAIDIDQDVLDICAKNLQNLNLEDKVTLICLDVTKESLSVQIDKIKNQFNLQNAKIITLSNPPFGVHQRGVDVLFLKQALAISNIIYSVHLANEKGQIYLTKNIEKMHGKITDRAKIFLVLKKTYDFHVQKQKKVECDVFRIVPQK